MYLAIISDTHGHVGHAEAAAQVLTRFKIQAVIHCGDIGDEEIPELFSRWPVHYVFGNVDCDLPPLRAAISAAGGTCHERFGSLELAGANVAFLHGDDTRLLDETIRGGTYDLVCHGHTHVAAQKLVGKTIVLNPGALYRANPHSLAIVTLPELAIVQVVVT